MVIGNLAHESVGLAGKQLLTHCSVVWHWSSASSQGTRELFLDSLAEIQLTHHTAHLFKAHSWQFLVYPELCNLHHYHFPEHFHPPQKTLLLISPHSSFSPISPPSNPRKSLIRFSSPGICLFCTFHRHITQHVFLPDWLLLLGIMFSSSSEL